MSEYICAWDGTEIVHDEDRPQPVTELVRCRDCREVRHELPARVGNYEQPERWVCQWWAKCETLPDAFCSFGKRAAK